MEQVESIVTSVVDQFGLYTEEVQIRTHGTARILSVVVDKESGTDQVDLDTISELTVVISETLDAQWSDQRPYELEVSSRGVSRPLEEPRHYRRNIGRLVAVTTTDGQKKLFRLKDADEEKITVQQQLPPPKKGMKAKLGPEEMIDFSQIVRAKVEVEFSGSDWL